MAPATYVFARPGSFEQRCHGMLDVGRRLAAIAAGRALVIEVVAPVRGMDTVKITAVPREPGLPEVLGLVSHRAAGDLRNRVALGVALAESDSAAERLRAVA